MCVKFITKKKKKKNHDTFNSPIHLTLFKIISIILCAQESPYMSYIPSPTLRSSPNVVWEVSQALTQHTRSHFTLSWWTKCTEQLNAHTSCSSHKSVTVKRTISFLLHYQFYLSGKKTWVWIITITCIRKTLWLAHLHALLQIRQMAYRISIYLSIYVQYIMWESGDV